MNPATRLLAELRSRRPTDYLAIAVTISLPWSTSTTAVLMVLWLLAFLPIIDFSGLRKELATPAGGLPVLLVAVAELGPMSAGQTVFTASGNSRSCCSSRWFSPISGIQMSVCESF